MKKRLCLLAVCLCLSALSFARDTGRTRVFLLGGQSNMDGRGDGSKLTEEDQRRLDAVKDRVQLAYNMEPVRPLGVTIPQPWTARKFKLEKTFGPELFFGIRMAEAYPEDRILLIKRSKGGMSLFGAWNPEWTEEKARAMGEEDQPRFYEELLAMTRKILEEQGLDETHLRGMLWVQGESDTGTKRHGTIPADTYGSNLGNLIRSIRADTDRENLPFLMLQVGGGKVVEGMKETAAKLEHVTFIPQNKKNPEAPNYLPGYGPPVGHYNYEGMKRIGNLFADAFLNNYRDR